MNAETSFASNDMNLVIHQSRVQPTSPWTSNSTHDVAHRLKRTPKRQTLRAYSRAATGLNHEENAITDVLEHTALSKE